LSGLFGGRQPVGEQDSSAAADEVRRHASSSAWPTREQANSSTGTGSAAPPPSSQRGDLLAQLVGPKFFRYLLESKAAGQLHAARAAANWTQRAAGTALHSLGLVFVDWSPLSLREGAAGGPEVAGEGRRKPPSELLAQIGRVGIPFAPMALVRRAQGQPGSRRRPHALGVEMVELPLPAWSGKPQPSAKEEAPPSSGVWGSLWAPAGNFGERPGDHYAAQYADFLGRLPSFVGRWLLEAGALSGGQKRAQPERKEAGGSLWASLWGSVEQEAEAEVGAPPLGRRKPAWSWAAGEERQVVEERVQQLRLEDGSWFAPHFDCGLANRWLLTYSVPFFASAKATFPTSQRGAPRELRAPAGRSRRQHAVGQEFGQLDPPLEQEPQMLQLR